MILFFLSSGLFLGWSLGANDAANVFGSAVGSRMLKFKKAAIIASVFVILGAVIQGSGASHTLGKLGSVSALAGSFTVALAAAFTVFTMTKWKVPVSTSQAIVGAIIGWNFYTGNTTDLDSLTKIVTTWIAGPILGAVFAILIYLLLSTYLNKAKLHLVKMDAYMRTGLIVVGAFGSYSLGANNIANVMGVFVPAIHLDPITIGFITLSGAQQLFFVGSVAIAIGIITYSKRVMDTVGNDLMDLSPISALVVVFSHSMVLFVFSSQGLSDFVQSIGLPAIPLVPVSSSQAIVGAILGLGLLKGGRNVNYKVLGSISIGWITTPIIAGLLAFISLFFVNNVFKLEVENKETVNTNKVEVPILEQAISNTETFSTNIEGERQKIKVENLKNEKSYFSTLSILIITVLVIISILIAVFFIVQKRKILSKYNSESKAQLHEISVLKAQKNELLKQNKKINAELAKEINYKKKELMNLALNIIQKNEFIQTLRNKIVKLTSTATNISNQKDLKKLSLIIKEHLYIDKDREVFQLYVDELHQDFLVQLDKEYPSFTNNEKRLCVLLRLGLASKEIAGVLNISTKSVEMNRYRLRKKMKISGSENLSEVISKL